MPVRRLAYPSRPTSDDTPSVPTARDGAAGERSGRRSAPAGGAGLRRDIQGLRAVAVSLVVLSHSGVSHVAGGYIGVDVFFVISGFLITSLMLREWSREGRISLGRFYARRALRLLPASTLVVLVTLAGSWLFLGPLRFADYAKDAIASAWYVVNFRLAEAGTDYFNTDVPPSPFQHFWSLAVEEQFYLIWPIVLIVALKLFRRRALLAIPLLALATASFALNLHLTESSPSWAYFGSPGRVWELAVGALLALAAHRLHTIPRPAAAALSWAGLAAIAYAAVAFDESTRFPGHNALVPVLGAAAVLAGGAAAGRYGAGAVLSLRPAVWIGGISYAWYLWHWPLILIVPAAAGFGAHDGPLRLIAALGGIVLAWLTLHLVENPMRFHRAFKARAGRGLSVGLGLSAVAAAAAVFAAQFPPVLDSGVARQSTKETIAAASDPRAALVELLQQRVEKLPSNLDPSLRETAYKRSEVYTDDCALTMTDEVQTQPCLYGDTTADRTVVLFGDSHVAQWFPALDAIARKHHWRLYSFTKNACKVSQITIEYNGGPYSTCDDWRAATLDRIRKLEPELVITSSSNSAKLYGGGDMAQAWGKGQAETYRTLQQGRTRVLTLLDTPWPKNNAVDCAVAHPDSLSSCARHRSGADPQPEVTEAIRAAAAAENVPTIDPYDWVCAPSGNCPVVVGNTMVYRDYGHLADGFVEALTPVLEDELLRLFGADLSRRPGT
ncbi:acyltransferase family protein [Streptomyces sp. TRM70350]|uniref:acyltransferase family protein n=1 Tax=Streptomyces sp. TRM70350 TaxID=2856165 RepID=UPI001C494D0A|nr:acyltransferase family protein [Streptomyces sp. TRM70350]MBV7695263.1 acyltransferase [Streptomyces sp. TRM70350]